MRRQGQLRWRAALAACGLTYGYMVFFLVVFFEAMFSSGGDLPIPFGLLGALHGVAILLTIYVAVVGVRDVRRYSSLERQERMAWIAVLVVLNVFALPVYWWRYARLRAAPPADNRLA
jgi:hypothetical protein